ncbi:hypothetical protein NW762_012922 [Fusarium torreyae]|uniref:Ubiquitin-like protease family profile domain-containing protein n=1 Tax=Fusarium torreyae TaxID=1237075 RepID=A0A9W8V819_9HYPO|nr:hypothetical protein NW762_012922 [Fusarium torreyae]
MARTRGAKKRQPSSQSTSPPTRLSKKRATNQLGPNASPSVEQETNPTLEDCTISTNKASTTPNCPGQLKSGWWPDQYAPENPDGKNIRGKMNSIIRQFRKDGRDPNDMWSEEGEGGLMVQAIRQSDRKIVTQRIFRDVEFSAAPVNHDNPAEATSRSINPESNDNATEASLALGSPFHESSHITAERCATPAHLPLGPLEDTVSTLENDLKLQSNDIGRCAMLFPRSLDWHVFEPGHPFGSETLSRKLTATNLVFLINAKHHWSLCHLDMKRYCLDHYNSIGDMSMLVHSLKVWLEGQPGLELGQGIAIENKTGLQQKDDSNCGIFMLAILQSLLNNQTIPEQVNATELRQYYIQCLKATTADTFHPTAVTSVPSTPQSDGFLMSAFLPKMEASPGMLTPLPSSRAHWRNAPNHYSPAQAELLAAPSTVAPTDHSQPYPSAPLLEAQAALNYHKALAESRVKLQTHLEEEKTNLFTQTEDISRMEQACREKSEQLERNKQAAQDLRKQLNELEARCAGQDLQIQISKRKFPARSYAKQRL